MKYILTTTENEILGPFVSVEPTDNGYLCDGSEIQVTAYGPLTLSEVPDDYETPGQIAGYNNQQAQLRAKAYPIDSDPIFFQWQRGTRTQQEWLDAVAAVQAQYPYKEHV